MVRLLAPEAESLPHRIGDGGQVLESAVRRRGAPDGLVVEHHVQLAGQNQHADAREHSLDHRR